MEYSGIILMVVIFGAFYMLLIRPQQKEQKNRREMLQSLKKGDRVVAAGIYGVIKEIDDKVISLRVADNVNLKIVRNAVNYVVDDDDE